MVILLKYYIIARNVIWLRWQCYAFRLIVIIICLMPYDKSPIIAQIWFFMDIYFFDDSLDYNAKKRVGFDSNVLLEATRLHILWRHIWACQKYSNGWITSNRYGLFNWCMNEYSFASWYFFIDPDRNFNEHVRLNFYECLNICFVILLKVALTGWFYQ